MKIIKNTFLSFLQVLAIISFVGCIVLFIGNANLDLTKIGKYYNYFSSIDDYKMYKVPINNLDSLLNNEQYAPINYATSPHKKLQNVFIKLDYDWEKCMKTYEDESGNIHAAPNTLIPVRYNKLTGDAFCSFYIKNSFSETIDSVCKINQYFKWFYYLMIVFIISFPLFLIFGFLFRSFTFERVLPFYILFGAIVFILGFVIIGLTILLPLSYLNDRYLNHEEYQKKYIQIDSFDVVITTTSNGKRKRSTFSGFNGECYSKQLGTIPIEVKGNFLLKYDDEYEIQKAQMFVWYNPKKKLAFLANDNLPLKGYKESVFEKLNNMKIGYYIIIFCFTSILIMYLIRKKYPIN